MEASELVAKVRKRYDLTQTQLARILGVSQPTIGSYEAGEVDKPNYKIVKRLEDILAGKEPIPAVLRVADKKLFRQLIMGAELIDNEWLTTDMVPKLQELINRARKSRHTESTENVMGVSTGSHSAGSGKIKDGCQPRDKKSPKFPASGRRNESP